MCTAAQRILSPLGQKTYGCDAEECQIGGKMMAQGVSPIRNAQGRGGTIARQAGRAAGARTGTMWRL
jgi:hypothetical protein